MSLWDLTDGTKANETGTSFEMGGGSIEPIPDNTDLLAFIEQVDWEQNDNISGGMKYIEITWSVLKPSEYANRKIFQKIKVMEPDAKKADNARRMFAAIDANAGGKLAAAGGDPTGFDMMAALANKQMLIKSKVWEMENNGETKRGNWIAAVSPKATPQEKPAAPVGDQSEGDELQF